MASVEDTTTLDGAGYIVVALANPEVVEPVASQLDAFWQRRNTEVTYRGHDGDALAMKNTIPLLDRLPGYALLGAHKLAGPTRDLVGDPAIIDAVAGHDPRSYSVLHTELVEWNGNRSLTRDRWFVPDVAGRSTFAVWVPLEAVHDKAGPWRVYAGSHRLVYPEFDDSSFRAGGGRANPDAVHHARKHLVEHLHSHRYKPVAPARTPGEALIIGTDTVQDDAPPINVDYTRRALMAVVAGSTR